VGCTNSHEFKWLSRSGLGLFGEIHAALTKQTRVSLNTPITASNYFETEEEIKDVDGTNIARFDAAGLSLAFASNGSGRIAVSLFRVRGRNLRRV
jgi:hypothetical protein